MQRTLVVLHVVLASFYLPMGVMYAITGGLYGLGIKGGYETVETSVATDAPVAKELSQLVAIAEEALRDRGLADPTGSAGIKSSGTSFHLEWTGTERDVEVHPTEDPMVAKVRIKDTSAYRRLVQLHKAKGGELFKWFAATWMAGLVALFVTGGLMAYARKPFRRLALVASLLGIAAFVVLASAS
jgi:hypothetical protein